MGNIKQCYCAPSLLSADFSNIRYAIDIIHNSNADLIHLDVMDGNFVPNLTFGPKMIRDIRPHTSLPLDVHLMIESPEKSVSAYAEAGADYITFHYEASLHAHSLVEKIKILDKKVGISIVPSTPIWCITELLPFIDLVLIMTVNPGFGGQKIIPNCIDKIHKLNSIKVKKGYSFLISADGGINKNNAESIRNAGVDIIVAGSAFFNSKNPSAELLFLKGHKPV